LVALRGVLKKRFPNHKTGTLDQNLKVVVTRLLHGINYQALKDEHEKDFGQIDAILGMLNMDEKHLEANFAALVNDVYTQKPKREGSFITRCLLWSLPSREKLKVDHEVYLSDKKVSPSNEDEDDNAEGERVAL